MSLTFCEHPVSDQFPETILALIVASSNGGWGSGVRGWGVQRFAFSVQRLAFSIQRSTLRV